MRRTKEQRLINESKEAGAQFVKDYLHNTIGNIENFDGQSEAQDIAAGCGLDADFVYEGMLEELRRRGYQR